MKDKENAYIFDIDGTIANISHRLHYIDKSIHKPDWDTFHKECVNDSPIFPVISTLNSLLNTGCEIIFITTRPVKTKNDTINWLNKYISNKNYIIFMRNNNDFRKDADIKFEIYNTCIKDNYNILGVFEDRQQCVDMWRQDLNLICFQVDYGNY